MSLPQSCHTQEVFTIEFSLKKNNPYICPSISHLKATCPNSHGDIKYDIENIVNNSVITV